MAANQQAAGCPGNGGEHYRCHPVALQAMLSQRVHPVA